SPRARRAGTPASWSPTRVSGSPASPSSLLRFLMQLVFVAPRAGLPPLHPLGVLAPVLGRHVVAALAPRALQDDVLARHRGGPATAGSWRRRRRRRCGRLRGWRSAAVLPWRWG